MAERRSRAEAVLAFERTLGRQPSRRLSIQAMDQAVKQARPNMARRAVNMVGRTAGAGAAAIGPAAIAMSGALAYQQRKMTNAAAGEEPVEAVASEVAAGASASIKTALVIYGYTKALEAAAKALSSRSARAAAAVGPVGAALSVGPALYGAFKGWQNTGKVSGAVVGALSGGQSFEGQKKPEVRERQMAIAREAARRVGQDMATVNPTPSPAMANRTDGWVDGYQRVVRGQIQRVDGYDRKR